MQATTRSELSLYAPSGARKYVNALERQRVLSEMENIDRAKGLFALTLAWTGARISEVLALTPLSFQLDRNVVAIRTLKRRRFMMREVPIPPRLMQTLDEAFGLRAAQLRGDDGAMRVWQFSRQTGWRIIKRVMRVGLVAGAAACPKGLRHGFGIAAVSAGVPLTFVQRWLGHARLSTTGIYTDAMGDEEMAIARRMWRSAAVKTQRHPAGSYPPRGRLTMTDLIQKLKKRTQRRMSVSVDTLHKALPRLKIALDLEERDE